MDRGSAENARHISSEEAKVAFNGAAPVHITGKDQIEQEGAGID